MKKILIIISLFLLSQSVMSSEKVYLRGEFQVGGVWFAPDSIKHYFYANNNLIDSNTETSVDTTYTDSVGVDTDDSLWTDVLWVVYDDSVYPDGAYRYWDDGRQSYSFINVATGGVADTCQVYAVLKDLSGRDINNGQMTAELLGRDIQDTCNNTVIARYIGRARSNDTGLVTLGLIKTKCLEMPDGTNALYRLTITAPGFYFQTVDSIPDSNSWRITK